MVTNKFNTILSHEFLMNVPKLKCKKVISKKQLKKTSLV